MLSQLQSAHFSAQLHTQFSLQDIPSQTGDRIDLTLIEVNDWRNEPLVGKNTGGRNPFSILFLGPPSPVLPQQIYPLEHPELGRLEIFIVPVGARPEGILYEAIFT